MAEFRKYFYALAMVALLAGLTSPASAQIGMSCNAAQTVPASLRVEGMTELAGDIIIDCVGGTSTTAGVEVPNVNINVSVNVAITSKITGTVGGVNFDEAILIIDQPNTGTWANAVAAFGGPRNILNCGTAASPDNNVALGPGICRILAPGSAFATYDGVPNGQPGAQICGGGGTALPTGSFGCGRPNVFQARQDLFSGFPINQQRISFLNVPIDPPGPGTGPGTPGVTIPPNCDSSGICHRFLRITNIRVNAANLGGATGAVVSGAQVLADITINGTTGNLPVQNANALLIGRVNTTLAAPVGGTPALTLVGCRDTVADASSVTFAELVADAWKPRNIGLPLLNNVPATALYNLLPGVAAGTQAAAYSAGDCRQNVPGANYETEAGFQNTAGGIATVCPTGIPTPNNPPSGLGFGNVPVPTPNSAFDDNNSGTNIEQSGIATSGTRLMLNVQNIFGPPTGVVTVSVPSQIVLQNRGTLGASGVAILQAYGAGCTPTPAGDNTFCPGNGAMPIGGPVNYVPIALFNQGLCLTGIATGTPGTPIPGSVCSAGRVFYEVVFSNPGIQEQITIPFRVSYSASNISNPGLVLPVTPSPIAVANGQMGYAPHYPNAAPQAFATTASLPPAGTGFPYPRFVDAAAGPFPMFSISGRCTCNLLFPYVTDQVIIGNSAFDTGIAIANTSRDPGSVARANGLIGNFGFLAKAQEQQGPVQFWYYSTQQASGSPNFGNLGNGAQGNTQCTNLVTPGQCNNLNGLLTLNTGVNVPAGGVLGMSVKGGSTTWGLLGVDPFVTGAPNTFTGYIIAQASFQYCHGVAFTTTNGLANVAGLNIPSLSYVALTLDDNGLSPRTSATGESLGH